MSKKDKVLLNELESESVWEIVSKANSEKSEEKLA